MTETDFQLMSGLLLILVPAVTGFIGCAIWDYGYSRYRRWRDYVPPEPEVPGTAEELRAQSDQIRQAKAEKLIIEQINPLILSARNKGETSVGVIQQSVDEVWTTVKEILGQKYQIRKTGMKAEFIIDWSGTPEPIIQELSDGEWLLKLAETIKKHKTYASINYIEGYWASTSLPSKSKKDTISTVCKNLIEHIEKARS